MKNIHQKLLSYEDYIDVIRKIMLRLAAVFVVTFVVAFFEAGNILRWILGRFNLSNASIVTSSPFQFISLATKIGFYAGIFVCIPLAVYFSYHFLKDGLNKKERRLFFVLLPIGLVLFALGFAYSYTILFFYLNSVSTINLAFGIKNFWDISNFLYQIIFASVLLGIVFEFPIVLTFLMRIGMIQVETLRKYRFYAICGIFIFVGLLPPPDIFSTLLQAFPLVVLYEITVRVNLRYYARQARLAARLSRTQKAVDAVHIKPVNLPV